VRGPEVIEMDQDGNVYNAWGGRLRCRLLSPTGTDSSGSPVPGRRTAFLSSRATANWCGTSTIVRRRG
jgi:hypothetical protein